MSDATAVPAGSGALAIRRDDNRIAIIGELRTPADREQLRNAVDQVFATFEAAQQELIVDLERAMYLDVAALTVLLSTARRCVDRGLTLAIEGATPELLELLQVTRIDQVLHRHGARVSPAKVACE